MLQPPGSTLFPYTTLFRSIDVAERDDRVVLVFDIRGTLAGDDATRSEEHTSELQSRSDLVCRLLLEKKNTRIRRQTPRLTDPAPRAFRSEPHPSAPQSVRY